MGEHEDKVREAFRSGLEAAYSWGGLLANRNADTIIEGREAFEALLEQQERDVERLLATLEWIAVQAERMSESRGGDGVLESIGRKARRALAAGVSPGEPEKT